MKIAQFVRVFSVAMTLSLSAADVRQQPLKDLNGYFPFHAPVSMPAWEARKAEVRRQILVAEGLWPMPSKTPLNAVIHGRIDGGEYTVDKVFFESAPGFFVTGNLYRPKNLAGRARACSSRTVIEKTHVWRSSLRPR